MGQRSINSVAGGRVMVGMAMLALAGSLGGCGSMVADLPLIGLPADAPARPKEPRAFLPVHDMPPPRQDTMTTADQAKLQSELAAARDHQAAVAK